jgi:hypothetical protein
MAIQTPRQSPSRFVAIFYPSGMAPGHWVPEQTGPLPAVFPDSLENHSMSILKPLEPLREHLVVLSGLWAKSSEPPDGKTGSDQFVSAAFLTAHKPRKTSGSDINVGSASIDQTIAARIAGGLAVPSLQLKAEEAAGSPSSSCGEGYSCWYTETISWATANTPLPMELRPQAVFERLFGSGSTPAERAARREQQRSILDGLVEDISRLKRDVGVHDRQTLDRFTEEVRESERRLQFAEQAAAQLSGVRQPLELPVAYDDLIKLHYDLVTLGFQTDTTRVVTMLGARDYTGRSYPFPKSELFPDGGSSVSLTGGSRHSNDPLRVRGFAQLNRYHVSTMAYLAGKLKSVREADGTLLDHSMILYGSNMGNSSQNEHFDVPHLLVGGLNGKLRGGRHLAFPRKSVTTGNLLLTILNMYGLEATTQGDSTGRLAEL